jgi:hypothetical protein
VSGAAFDWQVLAVTLAALVGAVVLLRPLLASRRAKTESGACGRCSSAACGKESAVPAGGPTGLVTLGAGRGLGGRAGGPPLTPPAAPAADAGRWRSR